MRAVPDRPDVEPIRVAGDDLVVELAGGGLLGEQPLRVTQVLAGLIDDGRIPYSALAEEIGSSNTLVHQRVKKLKDLGILTTAVNIPQILSPVMAAVLLGLFANDYSVIFWAAVIFVFGSALCVLPIRSVR